MIIKLKNINFIHIKKSSKKVISFYNIRHSMFTEIWKYTVKQPLPYMTI